MLTLLVTACNASPSANGEAVLPQKSTTTMEAVDMAVPVDEDAGVSELKPFVDDGKTVLASRRGDLDGDGIDDVVLVLDAPRKDGDQLADRAQRSVLLLIRDDAGQLRKVELDAMRKDC